MDFLNSNYALDQLTFLDPINLRVRLLLIEKVCSNIRQLSNPK